MSVTVEQAVAALKEADLVDASGHLKAGGRDEVLDSITRWRSHNLRAHVLVIDPGESFSDLISAFDALDYDEQADLLLLFNTRDWVARGWGLSGDALAKALGSARPKQRTTYARILVGGLDRLGELAVTSSGGSVGVSRGTVGLGVGVGLLAVGGVAFIVRRRVQREREALAAFKAACTSAERAYADVIMAWETSGEKQKGADVPVQAAELKRRLDAVISEVRKTPLGAGDRVTLGRVLQIENELVALRSSIPNRGKQ